MADQGTPITNLTIQITANADKAARTFDRLASSADRMGGSARNAAGGMRVLKDNMRQSRGDAESTRASFDGFMSRIGNLSASVGKFGSGIKTAFKGIASAVGLASKPLSIFGKQLGTELGGGLRMVTGPLTGFLGGLLRIARIRILRSIIKDIGQSFKDLYGWSKAFGTEFSKSMNTINTATTYLRNSLAAMVAPLADALAPVIDTIVDKIVEAINWVNQLFAALTGASTYTVAKKVAIEWGDTFTNSSNKAKKSVDKFKQSLMSFDEINSLKAPKDDSSSGNTGSSPYSDQYKLMFEQKKLPNSFGDIKNFAEQLKAAVKASDWKGVGTLIGNKVNELINKIDFAGAGTKVGKGINAWFSTKYWTLDAINFTNIGASIADFLNKAILEIDFSTVGASLSQKVGIIGDTIIGFFTTFDWGKAASAIGDFIIGMYTELTKWLKSITWVDIGSALYDNLKKVLKTVNFAGIAQAIFTLLGTALNTLFGLGEGFLGSFLDDVAAWWKDSLETDDKSFIGVAGAILKAIGKGFVNIGTWVFNNIVTPFVTALTGESWDGLIPVGIKAIGKVKEGWDTLSKAAFVIVATVKNTAATWKANIKTWWDETFDEKTPIGKFFVNVKNTGEIWWKSLKLYFADKFGEDSPVGKFFVNVKNTAEKWWTDISSFWSAILTGDKDKALTIGVKIINGAQQWWADVKKWWKEVVGDLTSRLTIKLPKIEVNWKWKGGDLLGIWVPSFNVRWNAKGGILDGAQIFGMMGNTALGGGEAGREALLPLDQNTEWMDTLADRVYARSTQNGTALQSEGIDYTRLANTMVAAMKSAGVGATYLDGRMLAQSINRESRRLGTPAVTF